MHDRLSALLDLEVVGEVTEVGARFFDACLGRVCLPRIDRERVGGLVERVRREFGNEVQVRDQLFPSDSSQIVRGLVELSLRDPELDSTYRLQITTKPLVAFYERRFMLDPGVAGDLMGTLCRGLDVLVGGNREVPLRILSGYDELTRRYLERLDRVVQASLLGEAIDVVPLVEELVEPTRAAWRLVPWPLRAKLSPVSRVPAERIARHDRVHRRTVLVAADLEQGKLVYSYAHQHHALEEYDQVLSWMVEIRKAMLETYPAPRYAATMARASSVETFVDHFPGFRGLVGPRLAGANGAGEARR